jgi:AraC family transcriptional regulator
MLVPMCPGTLGLARPGAIDYYRWDPDGETVHAYVHFAIREPGPLPDETAWPLVRSLPTVPVLDGLCSYLLELAGQPGELARRRSDQLVGLLLELFVIGPFRTAGAALSPAVAAMVETVRSHWRGGPVAVPVAALAGGAGVSTGHLFRIFRSEYGCSPARALEAVRLARAAILLQRSNATVAEIAHRSGFANPYHFSRRFAAVYNNPPGAFRALAVPLDPYRFVREAGLLPLAHALLDA